MPLVAQPVAHGTRAAYLRGCHCKRCQRANAVYQSELRARNRGLTPVPKLPPDEPVTAGQDDFDDFKIEVTLPRLEWDVFVAEAGRRGVPVQWLLEDVLDAALDGLGAV